MRTNCVKCGTALHGKNAQDMGICVECWNIENSDFDEEPEGITRPIEKSNYQRVLEEKAELLQQVAEITKENESYKGAILTWNEYSKKVNEELSRLREREKELVEAITRRKNWCDAAYEDSKKYNDWDDPSTLLANERHSLQSLLSKFEVPNQS